MALRSESADAQAWLAYAQMLSSATVPAARVSGILRAIELAPGRLDFRLRYTDISILQGHIEEARQLLTVSIAAVPFDSSSAAAARTRLDAIAANREPSFGFRPVRPGEQREAGLLRSLACEAGGVRFEVEAGGRPRSRSRPAWKTSS